MLAVSTLSFGFAATARVVSATTAHPAPYPIIDEWNYGVSDNYGYSNYYVKSPNNIGSKSSVTNLWGTVKDRDSQKYGWANSSATKSWNDVRLNAHWNYFKF
ncbi:TPA: hypothetical protein TVQ98_000619 [Streptococcus equi subsp. zooepidemicus]|uniref:hypothetical protein n=2 Tax=Streptococcus equi TaxID=1336 RepID=UPI0024AE05D7|nr:hypothetical protein [Streptococcus equi]MDI5916781.1 hypothetical protein [Streptococcus equi subsp. zooepidemicus]HEK9982672.1 hypothetical protein [Streptococcus equi subsp. zooepidemicus]HEL0587922.1 hypothetical protein [Streptococcus equi subsp. zooepidemicus]HEL0643159.1 hypothetical protein [Streptococcus equi subsp. zooepidemicus]HEL0710259.1 hypothetical protein [Streptococcus equi subsp. zooepidemicus]